MFKKILTGTLFATSLAGIAFATTGSAQASYGYGYGGGYGYNSGYGGYYSEYRPVYHRSCYIEKRWVDGYYGGFWKRVKVCY